MQQSTPPLNEVGITGIIVFAAVVLLVLLLVVLGWPASYRERQRALKGRWMSWAEEKDGGE